MSVDAHIVPIDTRVVDWSTSCYHYAGDMRVFPHGCSSFTSESPPVSCKALTLAEDLTLDGVTYIMGTEILPRKETKEEYLARALGLCFHNWGNATHDRGASDNAGRPVFQFTCSKCGAKEYGVYLTVPEFSSWESFGKLYGWAFGKSWWADFWGKNKDTIILTPESFSEAIYTYLVGSEAV